MPSTLQRGHPLPDQPLHWREWRRSRGHRRPPRQACVATPHHTPRAAGRGPKATQPARTTPPSATRPASVARCDAQCCAPWRLLAAELALDAALAATLATPGATPDWLRQRSPTLATFHCPLPNISHWLRPSFKPSAASQSAKTTRLPSMAPPPARLTHLSPAGFASWPFPCNCHDSRPSAAAMAAAHSCSATAAPSVPTLPAYIAAGARRRRGRVWITEAHTAFHHQAKLCRSCGSADKQERRVGRRRPAVAMVRMCPQGRARQQRSAKEEAGGHGESGRQQRWGRAALQSSPLRTPAARIRQQPGAPAPPRHPPHPLPPPSPHPAPPHPQRAHAGRG